FIRVGTRARAATSGTSPVGPVRIGGLIQAVVVPRNVQVIGDGAVRHRIPALRVVITHRDLLAPTLVNAIPVDERLAGLRSDVRQVEFGNELRERRCPEKFAGLTVEGPQTTRLAQ